MDGTSVPSLAPTSAPRARKASAHPRNGHTRCRGRSLGTHSMAFSSRATYPRCPHRVIPRDRCGRPVRLPTESSTPSRHERRRPQASNEFPLLMGPRKAKLSRGVHLQVARTLLRRNGSFTPKAECPLSGRRSHCRVLICQTAREVDPRSASNFDPSIA